MTLMSVTDHAQIQSVTASLSFERIYLDKREPSAINSRDRLGMHLYANQTQRKAVPCEM